jgi:hypothetical protein
MSHESNLESHMRSSDAFHLRTKLALCTLFLGTLAAPLSGQELRDGPGGEPPIEIPRLEGTVILDGRPDEGVWGQAAAFTGVMHLPDFGAEPTQRTEFLLFHDGKYLYYACRAYEEDPSQVRITTLARDVSMYNTDGCTFSLDSYNDEENSLFFGMTPASVRTDWTFANDASGPPNMDWNTFWDARGTLTEFGWSGEMRIPFSSLGFQVGADGRVVMGFSVGRSIVRNAERTIHPAIAPNWGPGSMVKPSQMRKMILTGVQAERPLYLTPYALTGGGHTHTLNTPRDAYIRDGRRVLEVGGDLRYGLTRNLNLDLTVNTDFAQVESDNLQVNLTRFSLFFPEKRRFFQERAAIFEFPLGFNERLFHSRRIGLVNGEPVTLYGGARLVGRVGEWDVGFLNMQTGGADAAIVGVADLPSENMGVLRLRRRVLNQFSYLGGIATSRIGSDGSRNLLYGSDAVLRLFGQDYLTVNWSQSFDEVADGLPRDVRGEGFFDRSLTRANWQRRGNDGPTYSFDVTRAGEIFEPGLGFLFRRNYTSGAANVGYGWRPGQGSALNRYSLAFQSNVYRRNTLETVESASYGIRSQVETRTSHQFTASLARSYEDLLRPFALSRTVVVPVDSYWFTEASVDYNPPGGALFKPAMSLAGGQFYDGTRVAATFSPSWSASPHVSLGGAYQFNRVQFESRDQTFISHLVRFRSDFTFSTITSASAFVQYNNNGNVVVSNIRFRYNPFEGRDLYVVWNEVMNSNRFVLEPNAPFSQQRSLMLKYVHTLTLGL